MIVCHTVLCCPPGVAVTTFRRFQGAAKKPQRKSKISARKKMDDLQQLHSESQRLVRGE